jgi:MSHA type pilus biogenesis protein MshL
MTNQVSFLSLSGRLLTVICLSITLWSCTSTPPPVLETASVERVAVPVVDTVDVPLVERQGRLQELVQNSMPQVEPRYSFHAVGVPVADALRLFARDNALNLVLDRGLEGELTVDFVDLSLKQALDAMLDAHDYAWEMNQNLIRVRREITRSFDVDYLRLIRNSESKNESGKFGISGGDSSENQADNEFTVEQENEVDFWKELIDELDALIGDEGRVVANKTAGFISVSASKREVEKVEAYLDRVKTGSMRQVNIQAKIVEVELSDRTQLGIDWAAPDLAQLGRFTLSRNTLAGAESIGAAGAEGVFLRASVGGDTRALLKALQEQGDLNVLSQPRIKVINNQTAQIRVARDEPYFVKTEGAVAPSSQSGGQGAVFEQRTATIGLVVQVTPYISADGWITMEVAPVLTNKVGQIGIPSEDSDGNFTIQENVGPPIVDVKQTTVVVRIRSGETAVIGGLIQERVDEQESRVPVLGDLPVVGAAFRTNTKTKSKNELVIMITPVAEYIETGEAQYAW